MQRDLGLIRQILFKMEAHSAGFAPRDLSLDGFSADQVSYHIWLLGQADLMKVIETTTHGSASPGAIPVSLTWSGHDFLDVARSDTTWSKAIEKVKTVGGSVSLAILKQLLEAILKGPLGL